MSQKPKLNPVITRIKLNPEQAVLACNCYSGSVLAMLGTGRTRSTCVITPSKTTRNQRSAAGGVSS
jgi:hypothetical protein